MPASRKDFSRGAIEHDLLLHLTEVLDINFFVIGTDGRYIYKNSIIREIVGEAERGDLIDPKAWQVSLQVMETRKRIVLEEEAEGRWFLSVKAPFIKNNEVIGVIGIAVDITRQKQAEISKMQFLENMRHDIRTPLTGIRGFAGLLKTESNPQKITHYADNLITSSEALLEFLDGILETIHLTWGETPVLKNKFNLKQLLQSVIDLNIAKAIEKNLELKLIFGKNIPEFTLGDSRRIHRILLELITNALKFTDEGRIELLVEKNRKNKGRKTFLLKISVTDTGIGIPEDKKEEIFIEFNRLHPAYKGHYKGLGLGLTMVRRFVDELGGEIYVNSNAGKGSVFSLILPLGLPLTDDHFGIEHQGFPTVPSSQTIPENILQKKMAAITPEKQNLNINIHAKKVLIVEDNKLAAEVAKAMLLQLGCNPDVAFSGEEALEKIAGNPYDLILMDLGLPGKDGYEVTQEIRKQELISKHHTPVIALTAHAEGENNLACIRAGMDMVLSKPLSMDTIKNLFHVLFENPKM